MLKAFLKKPHESSYLLQAFEETPTRMSIQINRLEEGHNSNQTEGKIYNEQHRNNCKIYNGQPRNNCKILKQNEKYIMNNTETIVKS